MNISPISNTSITTYMRPLTPIAQVQKVHGGASSKLLKASKSIQLPEEDNGSTYDRSLRENQDISRKGSRISIIA